MVYLSGIVGYHLNGFHPPFFTLRRAWENLFICLYRFGSMKFAYLIYLTLLVCVILLAQDPAPNGGELMRLNISTSGSLKDTRRGYHQLLDGIKDEIMAMQKDNHTDQDCALTCNRMRSDARRVARSANSSLVHKGIGVLLRFRDGYQYGIRYIFYAVNKDIYDLAHGKVPVTALLVCKQFMVCVFPGDGQYCPSYDFLTGVLSKKDSDILSGCTKSNERVDSLFS